MANGIRLDEADRLMIQLVLKATAAGLAEAQSTGLIRFPFGLLSVESIEKRLNSVVDAFLNKATEIAATES